MGKDRPRAARSARLITVIEVDSAADERLSDYQRLTDVALRSRIEKPLGLFIAESSLVITRALAAGHPMRSALVSPRWLPSLEPLLADVDAPVYVGSEALLAEITGFNVHRGALASMRRLPLRSLSSVLASATRVVVIEDMVSHTNLGAVFRSAGALGFDGVLLTPSSADPLYRRSVRVSMGGVFSLPWTRLDAWPSDAASLRAAGFSIVGLTPDPDAIDIASLSLDPADRIALVLGTEGDGLSGLARSVADQLVRIPMSAGVDSLNVAAAAAVAFYALSARQPR